MALQVWIPLVGPKVDNQGLLLTSGSIHGGVTTGSGEGLLGPGTRIGLNPSDSLSRIRFTSPTIISESLGLDQTFMAWVYPEGDHSNYCGTIVSSGNWNGNTSWTFSIGKANGHVYGARRYSQTGIACSVPTGSWTHLAVVRDGTTGISTYYKNGVYVGTQSLLSGSLESSNSQSFSVGLAEYSNWCPFNGRIQDLRIYDEKLSVRQIQEIAKGLVAHYTLSDYSIQKNDNWIGPKLYDSSGNGYDRFQIQRGVFVFDVDSPRRRSCVEFDTTAKFCQITDLPALGDVYSISWWSYMTTRTNVMAWGFNNGNKLNLYGQYCNTGDGTSNPFYVPGTTTVITNPSSNAWHHFVMTGDGTQTLLYVDGELYGQAKTFKPCTGTTLYLNGWDSSTSYKNAGAKLSDFRIYATCLNADQVRELYGNPVSVCKGGTLMCMEITE